MLYWEIDCIERNGRITDYSVEFEGKDGAMIPVEVVGQNFTATRLISGTQYVLRVAGININGTGPFNRRTISTAEDSTFFILFYQCVLHNVFF